MDEAVAEQGGDDFLLVGSIDLVTPIPFYKKMIAEVMDLWCGAEDYATEATYWIHGQGDYSVRTELNNGGRVWTYKNTAGETVGFGSLNRRIWQIDNEPSLEVQYIPMLGVFTDFQGKPADGTPKYCYQILDHLIDEAEAQASTHPTLGLSVRPENDKAIHIYTKTGFRWFKTDRGWSRMVLPLGSTE